MSTDHRLHNHGLHPPVSPLLIRYTPEVAAMLEGYQDQIGRLIDDTMADHYRRAMDQHLRQRARAIEMFTGRRPPPEDYYR